MSDRWTAENFVGGHAALDFLNTAGGATKARDVERLTAFEDAVDWAGAARLLAGREPDDLRTAAAADPVAGARALESLRSQREALHAALLAVVEGREPPEANRRRVEADARSAYMAARLSLRGAGGGWTLTAETCGLDLIARRLALSADSLVNGPDLADVRACQACSWLFLDPSPSKRRRWCSMAACGNRAKANRHYRRASK